MRRHALPVVLALLLVVAGVTAGVAAADDTGGTGSPVAEIAGPSDAVDAVGTEGVVLQADGFDVTPSTTFHVRLQPNANAEWTVSVEYRLSDGNETAAFEAVAEDFESGMAGPSADLYRNLAAGAADRTGREMAIQGVEREATIDETPDVEDESVVAVGTLELRFVWTNFLERDGEKLRLGDVFRTENNGTWLRTLGANQRLVIETPDRYQVSSTPGVSVSLQENAVVIEGPRTFGPNQYVQVVYSQTAVGSQPPWLLLAGAVVLAGLIVVVGLFAYRRVAGPNGWTPGGEPGDGAGGAGVAVEPGNGAGEAVEADGTAEGGGAAAGNGAAASNGAGNGGGASNGGTAGSGAGPPAGGEAESAEGPAGGQAGSEPGEDDAEEDLSLLSDAERVERLLDRNGGRMRQADIVEETDWSDAKVSQLLSSMADEGRVEKLRLGRENLISLPEYGEDEESTT
ncbi:helix-turn-helix transcriptional regulator [Haloparvum sp. PAK95]|uniref:helix-turn-helix transcriptional regulator n=1 Tax=Haloparvum sp. PAK95 TaxID=3418962 RepID=UPI003D2EC6BE